MVAIMQGLTADDWSLKMLVFYLGSLKLESYRSTTNK